MGRVKYDHIKRLITLTSDNIKRLSLYCEKKNLLRNGNFKRFVQSKRDERKAICLFKRLAFNGIMSTVRVSH